VEVLPPHHIHNPSEIGLPEQLPEFYGKGTRHVTDRENTNGISWLIKSLLLGMVSGLIKCVSF